MSVFLKINAGNIDDYVRGLFQRVRHEMVMKGYQITSDGMNIKLECVPRKEGEPLIVEILQVGTGGTPMEVSLVSSLKVCMRRMGFKPINTSQNLFAV